MPRATTVESVVARLRALDINKISDTQLELLKRACFSVEDAARVTLHKRRHPPKVRKPPMIECGRCGVLLAEESVRAHILGHEAEDEAERAPAPPRLLLAV